MNENALDIFKINDGIWGIVNINNMISTPINCLTEVLSLVKDAKYKNLILNQTTYLNKHKSKLLSKVKQFKLRHDKGHLFSKLRKRCYDYKLLKEKCKEYEKEEVFI